MSNDNNDTAEIKTWHQTFDFESLMREARRHITQLAGNLWTDHNSSDPGITQLEVLAFCIADLSYRTSFDVKDILAGYKGDKSLPIDLPLADVALPNHPVTIQDLRKVLIDMAHPEQPKALLIRNAFPVIAEHTEIPFYAVSKKGKDSFLSFSTEYEEKYAAELIRNNELSSKGNVNGLKLAKVDPVAKALSPRPSSASISDYSEHNLAGVNYSKKKSYQFLDEIILNGLYNLQIEFEEESKLDASGNVRGNHLRDLNRNYFEEIITVDGQEYTISVLLPYWDEINWNLRNVILSSSTIAYRKRGKNQDEDYFIAVDKLNYDDYFYDYYAEVDLAEFKLTAFIKIKTRSTHSITANGKNYAFNINFLDWNEISNGVKRDYTQLYNQTPLPADLEATNVSLLDGEVLFDIKSKFEYDKFDALGNSKTKAVYLLARVEFEEGTIIGSGEEWAIGQQLEADFPLFFQRQIALEDHLFTHLTSNTAEIYLHYLEKIKRVFHLLYSHNKGVWNYVNQYRNLSEDISKFSASRVQEIALFGKILVEPNYNVNELLAEIYFQVDQFLNPLIQFKLLSEMVEKGFAFEDLYNGPLLEHGFIESSDLDNLKRRSVVYTSDLIRIIMDIPGIVAIQDFNISSYIDNRLMGRNVIDCLKLTNSNIYKPRFSAEKTNFKICIDDQPLVSDDVIIFDWYRQKLLDAKTLQIPSSDKIPLSLPLGENRNMEEYLSIQHDFPEVYGIGAFGLPRDASEERKAEAKQLKGFLLPFEQLLANYLKQVAHLPELFSYNRTIDQTYHTQPLYNVPDVQPLLAEFAQNNATWDTFKDDLEHSYQQTILAGESPEDFKSRRNRFLDQLLARFGEQFEQYATQMFNLHKDLLNDPLNGIEAYQIKRAQTLDRLIDDKISFAEDYSKVSGERYTSFDVAKITSDQPTFQWNNNNIESYKLRLCRLLGIKETNNSFLFGTETTDDGAVTDKEGMHIVEHILLRPRTDHTDLLDLQNRPDPEGGNFIYDSDKDPYSFQITIVLPIEADRFKHEAFRTFTEELIRKETPAHIVVNFRWMSSRCGKQFEHHYSLWKKNAHLMKPYHFQGVDEYAQIIQEELMSPTLLDSASNTANPAQVALIHSKKTKHIGIAASSTKAAPVSTIPTVELPSFNQLTLQDNLIKALNSSCVLTMSVYSQNHEAFNPNGNLISFEHTTTDIHFVRISEAGGELRLYKFSSNTNKWISKKVFKPIEENYIDLSNFLKEATLGLTENYGGVGIYKLQYQLESQERVEQLIQVTPRIVPIRIAIGKADVMLPFDTENDGVFSLINGEWKAHFLQFIPLGLESTFTISSTGNNLPPTKIAPKRGSDSIQLGDIYKQFGTGQFRIVYQSGGQQTFVDIELKWVVAINFFADQNPLFPDVNGIIAISSQTTHARAVFNPPYGTISIYKKDSAVVDSSINATTSKLETRRDVLVFQSSKESEWSIDRSVDTVYKDGGLYEFVYEFESNEVRQLVYIEPIKVVVVPDPAHQTTVEVFNQLEDKPLKMIGNQYHLVFDYQNSKVAYLLRFDLKVGVLSFIDEDGKTNKIEIKNGEYLIKIDSLKNEVYNVEFVPEIGCSISFEVLSVNINPTFKIENVSQTKLKYTATAIPMFQSTNTYIWRINEVYITRSKEPILELDFTKTDSIAITLTMHFEDYEASYEMKLTKDHLKKLL